MHIYALVPMVTCVLLALLLGSIFQRGPSHRTNQLASLILAGGVIFCFCEVAVSSSLRSEQALVWVRLAYLGWAFTGPVGLHLLLEVTRATSPRIRRLLPYAYALSGGLAVAAISTPWFYTEVVQGAWGWSYSVGPAFPLLVVTQVGLVGLGVMKSVQHYRGRGLPSELAQSSWLIGGLGTAILVGLSPHLVMAFDSEASIRPTGSLSFLILSLLIFGALHRFGYWMFAPGAYEREILASMANGVVFLHDDGRIRIANAAMARMMGCDSARLHDLNICQHIDVLDMLDDGAEGLDRELELRPFRGPPLPVAVSITRIRDKRGQRLGLVMVLADVGELVELRDRLVTSGRLAAVGELAAGVAHEINNPLTYVRANLSMLRQEWSDAHKQLARGASTRTLLRTLSDTEELINESLEGVDRAVAIVRDIKGFSRAGRGGRELVDLHPLLDAVVRVAGPQLSDAITIVRRHGDLPKILCAPHELTQVFLNLVVNASQAMPQGGTITIETRSESDHVVVLITDEGCGIAPENRDRIFDPFFTTKPVGQGTGLGLSLSYAIVRRHGGEILLESREKGQGTTFCVRLPDAASEAPGFTG